MNPRVQNIKYAFRVVVAHLAMHMLFFSFCFHKFTIKFHIPNTLYLGMVKYQKTNFGTLNKSVIMAQKVRLGTKKCTKEIKHIMFQEQVMHQETDGSQRQREKRFPEQ